MKNFSYENVKLEPCYLYGKQELNRNVTINAVYDRFYDTGRIGAFDFSYKEGDPKKPHIFWDSDVAKWMEGAAYILKHHSSPELEEKVDALVEKIKKNQGADGYFNIYFTVVEPEARFTDRDKHELYCAGHLIEAAVAYASVTGKTDFLECMENYADYIYKVFAEEKNAAFYTPGHEEIELALIYMYRYTGKVKYLNLAKYFIDTRGTVDEKFRDEQFQTHLPVREQTEALGHSVRAMYLYTGMAMLAKETNDEALLNACKVLWDDVTTKKMYVTGGIGSSNIGESFTTGYDLSNDHAYTETCAGIGLVFFAKAMLELENNAKYANVMERVLYNGVLSGISLDGRSFFYENPLEINLFEHFSCRCGTRKFPITQRVECFDCSCCPPNLNRLLPSLGSYIYGFDNDTVFVNQFIASSLDDRALKAKISTAYPIDGNVKINVEGASKVAVRIPFWCESFNINKPYVIENGYAIVDAKGEITVDFEMTPKAVWADPRIIKDAGKICIMRGPVVYCAEGIDNGENLHRFTVPSGFEYVEKNNELFGIPELEIEAYEKMTYEGELYSSHPPIKQKTVLKLIPYNCFANRGESDMLVWFVEEQR